MGSSADDALRSLVGSVRRADAALGRRRAGWRDRRRAEELGVAGALLAASTAAAPTVVHLVGGRTTIVEVRAVHPDHAVVRIDEATALLALRAVAVVEGRADDVRDLTDRAARTAGVVGREQLAEVLERLAPLGVEVLLGDGPAVGGCSGRSAPARWSSRRPRASRWSRWARWRWWCWPTPTGEGSVLVALALVAAAHDLGIEVLEGARSDAAGFDERLDVLLLEADDPTEAIAGDLASSMKR
ncbi:MAG: hypothetical protein R2702_00155 [Acidimicrobiales bacterium]